MKTNIMNERESDKTVSDAIVFGALLLAPVTGLLIAMIVHQTIDARFSEVLLITLAVVSPLCIAEEVIRWMLQKRNPVLKRIGYDRNGPERLSRFVAPGMQSASRRR